MSLDNVAFAAPYLTENSATSFPTIDTPTFEDDTPDDGSEFMSVCGFSFQGRSLTDTDDMVDVRIKGFGSAFGDTDLPSPSSLTNADVQGYCNDDNGLIRFILSKDDGTEILDTNDSDTANLPQMYGWRKEEVLRGDYIHGFIQQDKYFLTYIINYPIFFEFFGDSGYYADHPDRMANYSDQLDKTQLVPNALSPHANSVDSVITVDIYKGTEEDDYPALSPTDNNTISTELEAFYTSPTDAYQHLAFCKNDAAGVNNLGEDHMPTYIVDTLFCPWSYTTGTLLPNYLSEAFTEDVLLTEGFNVEILTDGSNITFNAAAGKGVGLGPACDQDKHPPLRRLGGAVPGDDGEIYIGGDKCLMVGPNSPVADADDDGEETLIDSYLISGQHPEMPGSDYDPKLYISGFCAQCCPCNHYENVYRALLNTGSPLWASKNPEEGGGEGLLSKIQKAVDYYTCLMNQYIAVAECFEQAPVVVQVVGWGHYGYLVSAQVLIQNHGSTDLTADALKVQFDFDANSSDPAVGEVSYVKGTAYANLDAKNLDDSEEFNPVQPLEDMQDPVDISPVDGSSKLVLTGGFLNGLTIKRGRYMSIGLTAYLKHAAAEDGGLCDAGVADSLDTAISAAVSGLTDTKYMDTNSYNCQETLFLATPCTPPIATVAWVDRDTSKLKIKFTDPLLDDQGANISSIRLKVSWKTMFHDWVPTTCVDSVCEDLCGNTMAYFPAIDWTDEDSWPYQGESTLSFTHETDSVYIANYPSGDFLYENSTESLNICSCPDCTGFECLYPAYAPRLNVTFEYDNKTNLITTYCPAVGEEDPLPVPFNIFDISTSLPADVGLPIVYYNCETDCTGSCNK